MGYDGVVDDFRACCELRRPERLPVFALGLEFDMRIGGVSYAENRTNVEKTVGCKAHAVVDLGYDLAEIFPDDYIEFEPLGLRMSEEPDRPTMPLEYLPFERGVLAGFTLPDPGRDMRLPIHLEMIRQTKARLEGTACVMGRIAAPFSTLGLIYGIDTLLIGMLEEPELVRDNLEFFVEHQIAFGKAQFEAGADMLWLGDCVASSNFLSPQWFEEFASGAAARVASALTPDGLVVYHSCETSVPHLELQCQLPVSAVNVGEGVNIADVRRQMQPEVCLMGNFDPMLLRDGTPEAVTAAAEAMVEENAEIGAYVFNTGEGIMRDTPYDNVKAMLHTARATADRVFGR